MSDSDSDFNNQPSDLGESTHAEMGMIYIDSTNTIRFAKMLQWCTVGSSLLAFGGIVAIINILPYPDKFAHSMIGVIIVFSMAVIFTLVIHQLWQHTELSKIERIEKDFSSLFRLVRRIKSSREANIYRYILLFFMVTIVVTSAFVTYIAINQFIR